MFERWKRKFRTPGDLALICAIGHFMWQVPRRLKRSELPDFLDEVRHLPRPSAADPAASVERIIRLRRPWFRLPWLAPYNTCFMRAMTLYRFIDAPGRDLRIHFVIEDGRRQGDRLRSHAWVTIDGVVIEEPDLRAMGVSEIYCHRASPAVIATAQATAS